MKKNATETKTTTAKFNPNQPRMNRMQFQKQRHRSVLSLKQTPDEENKLPAIFHRTENVTFKLPLKTRKLGVNATKTYRLDDSFSGVFEKSV